MIPNHTSREDELARRSIEISKFFRATVSNKAMVSQFLIDADVEKNRLQTEIYALERKKQRLEATVNRYQSLLSPIHEVPAEILSTIFGFCCEENVLSTTTPPPPVRLSMVCGRWRDIVLSTPSLWSSITIDFAEWNGAPDILGELTTQFMARSRQSPLRLTLLLDLPEEIFNESVSGEWTEVRPALDLLIENCTRWKEVTLSFTKPFFPFDIFRPIRGSLPSLEYLRFDHIRVSEIDGEWDESRFNFFEICPSLRSLHPSPILFDLDFTGLPWHQITSMKIETGFSPDFSLLSVCPTLKSLELSSVGGPPNLDASSLEHVVADSITSLAITHPTDQYDAYDFFKYTTLKNLESLSICGGANRRSANWQKWDDTHLNTFLLRSSCMITSLHLEAIPITDLQTVSLLRMMPSLQSLHIAEYTHHYLRNNIVTDSFLDSFTLSFPSSDSPSRTLLPALSKLKLVVQARGLQSQHWLEMISSRWVPDPKHAAELGVECLRSVSIVILGTNPNPRYPQDRSLDCLLCFRDAGMQLNVTYGTAAEFFKDGKTILM